MQSDQKPRRIDTQRAQPLSDFLPGLRGGRQIEPPFALFCPYAQSFENRKGALHIVSPGIPVDSNMEQERTLALSKAHPVRYFCQKQEQTTAKRFMRT